MIKIKEGLILSSSVNRCWELRPALTRIWSKLFTKLQVQCSLELDSFMLERFCEFGAAWSPAVSAQNILMASVWGWSAVRCLSFSHGSGLSVVTCRPAAWRNRSGSSVLKSFPARHSLTERLRGLYKACQGLLRNPAINPVRWSTAFWFLGVRSTSLTESETLGILFVEF